jgi:hypothetical protein
MSRLVFASIITALASTIAFSNSGVFSTLAALAAPVTAVNTAGPLYTTEQEHLVSEIAGSILNIAAFADRFDAGDPFHVRNVLPSSPTPKFTLARRAEVFTVEVPGHVWAPRSYGRLARSFMADGAGLSISEDPTHDRADVGVLLDPTADGLRFQNARLSRLLHDHPRAASIHERAALLLGAAASRRLAAGRDARPLLCRMTAHLAVARALHDGRLSADGELAERVLSGLAGRETTDRRSTDGPWIDGPVTFGDKPQVEIVPPEPAGGSQP